MSIKKHLSALYLLAVTNFLASSAFVFSLAVFTNGFAGADALGRYWVYVFLQKAVLGNQDMATRPIRATRSRRDNFITAVE